MQKPKAIVLFSGGLDSRLVVKILEEQGIEVTLLMFKLPFSCCNFDNSDFKGIEVIDCTKSSLFKEYLQIIRHPKYGRGSSMNPCIDCKIFMFRKAKEYADKNNINIIATGEVLGERPMSQTSDALKKIDKELGFELLRPLSAKLLPETSAEKEKLVDREKFFSISGRKREQQIELAKKFKIKYPTPAGGCLLCEKAYKPRIQDFFKNSKDFSAEQLQTLSSFRHFRSKETGGKIVLGRNQDENILLEQLNEKLKFNIIIPEETPGPTAIFENKADKQLVEALIEAYSSKDIQERKKFEAIKV
jgi:tRNA U34 2-thiouridine synthase MnmA/TrmU